MVMLQMPRSFVMIAGGRLLVAAAEDVKRAGHAEMHQQHLAGGQVGEQILGAPPEPGAGRSFDALHEVFRKRKAQVAAPRLDLGEARAFHHRRKAAAHGLDFGQLGHVLSVPEGRPCGKRVACAARPIPR